MKNTSLLAKPMGPSCVRRVAAVLVCCAALLAAATASATLITVTTTDDEFNNDGDCSLREATVAANTNAAVDACPAGAAASTDTIRLAGGSTYLLTLAQPAAAADDPKGGDLDILVNSGANPALIVDTDGQNGPATIQQTVQGEKVFQIQGATAELHDLVIAGGNPLDCGGGVTLFAPGSLVVDGCGFVGNSALNGGALCNFAGATMTVSNSFFADNSAGGLSNGGAIRNAGTLDVTGSTFLRNTPGGNGGAIRNDANVAGALQVTGSCFLDNGDTAVSNGTGAAQDATGNWWGSSSGPSGEGPGSGDSVAGFDFSGFLTHPATACLPFELTRNSGFLTDVLNDGVPDRWSATRFAAGDGRACSLDLSSCVLKLNGGGGLKVLTQVVRIGGLAGDKLTLRARSRAKDVPAAAGAYRVQATLFNLDGSRQIVKLKFDGGTHDFVELQKDVVASKDYKKVRVEVLYGKPSGIARFDGVRLTLDP